MTMRKACSWALIAALALMAAPAGAQVAPNTIWGEVPQGLSGNVSNAVLLDANGNVVSTVQVVNGKFEFLNVAPGDYSVQIKNAAGEVLATSPRSTLTTGGVLKVLFTGNSVVGAAVPKGHSTALIVGGGAVAVGVGTAVVLNKDKNKDKPPKSPKN